MKHIEFDPLARAELDAAAVHYEAEYEGRGFRFYSTVQRTLAAAALTPLAGQLFPGMPTELEMRHRIVPGFPFVIAYRIKDEVLRVFAVIHTRRRPGYWRERIDKSKE